MLADDSISHLTDYQDAGEVFPGINLNGGACFFLREKGHKGDCEVTYVGKNGHRTTLRRRLDEFDKFVRINEGVEIVQRVQRSGAPTFDRRVSTQKPFGIRTFVKGSAEKPDADAVPFYTNAGRRWIERSKIAVNEDWIEKFKVLIPCGTDGNEIYPLPILTEPIVAGPPSACSETYLVIGPFDHEADAVKTAQYMRTKFFRFLLHVRKPTQHNSRGTFAFIPDVGVDKEWDDALLYRHFSLSDAEIKLIEETIRDM